MTGTILPEGSMKSRRRFSQVLLWEGWVACCCVWQAAPLMALFSAAGSPLSVCCSRVCVSRQGSLKITASDHITKYLIYICLAWYVIKFFTSMLTYTKNANWGLRPYWSLPGKLGEGPRLRTKYTVLAVRALKIARVFHLETAESSERLCVYFHFITTYLINQGYSYLIWLFWNFLFHP